MTYGLDNRFRLGPWEVHVTLGELAGQPGTHHLEPKVMKVLVCLAQQAGDVVTREQLVHAVWDGRAVTDEVLSRCISQLRTALGDNTREPEYIQTIPKVGYRLIAPVEPLIRHGTDPPAPTSAATAEPTNRAARLWPGWLVACVIGIAGIGLAYILLDRPGDNPGAVESEQQVSIAVLPFTNYSNDDDNEYFADGLTEELIDRLANVPELKVVASTSVFAFKDQPDDARKIGRALEVRYLLQGSVRKEGERVRITAQLVDANEGFTQWSRKFDTALRDIFNVQDEISNGIVSELWPQLTGEPFTPIAVSQPTTVLTAYELLLRGRFQLKKRAEAPIRRSIELFQDAIALDPNFGQAYRELARAYVLLPTYAAVNANEMYQLAEATLARGIRMDPAIVDGIFDVQAFLHYSRWEWVEAEADFRRALEISPNDPSLHQWYSQLLAAVGKTELALQSVRRAKDLDLLSPVINQRLAVALLWVDQDAAAREQFNVAFELGLGARANLEAYTLLLLRQREFDLARDMLKELQRSFQRAADWIDPFIAAVRDPDAIPAARAALQQAAADGQISLKYLQGTLIMIGDADAAIDASFRLLDEPINFEVEFLFARETAMLRRHPRFGELVTRIGLDQYWETYGWPAHCSPAADSLACE